MYEEDDFLQLSGLQHFAFCRRQWALIHIEKLWEENLRTTEGNLLHARAHDESANEMRGDCFIVRGARVRSTTLGVSGQCDVLEFKRDSQGIAISGREGLWLPYPVEYKRGEPKDIDADRLQLCGQAMCLEEMLCFEVKEGALYYSQIRRREKVYFTDEMRNKVRDCLLEMHKLFKSNHTPKVKPTKSCNACSLKDLCMPRLMAYGSASDYLTSALREAL